MITYTVYVTQLYIHMCAHLLVYSINQCMKYSSCKTKHTSIICKIFACVIIVLNLNCLHKLLLCLFLIIIYVILSHPLHRVYTLLLLLIARTKFIEFSDELRYC